PRRDRRARQCRARDDARSRLQPPGRPQPPAPAVVVALRRLLAEGRLVAAVVLADPERDGTTAAVHLVLPLDRRRAAAADASVAAHPRGPDVTPIAHAAGRRALQRRHSPAGGATRGLRTFCLGRLRAIRL